MSNKNEIRFARIFRVLLILAIVITIYMGSWLNLFVAVLTLFLTHIPYIIANKWKIYLPAEMQLTILLFLFGSMFLGELRDFYERLWWWDVMLHTMSGVILGFTGFALVYALNSEEKVKVDLSPVFVVIFAFTFALATGAVWEIFEFSMDSLFGLNMQKSGLTDTMWDLIVDSLGALYACVKSYKYLRTGSSSFFIRGIIRFLRKNSKTELKQEKIVD